MKLGVFRVLRLVAIAVVSALGLGTIGSGVANAAEVWTYQGWFTLDGRFDYFDPGSDPYNAARFETHQLDVYVDLRVEDGRVVDGAVVAGPQCPREIRSATVRYTGQYEG